MKSGKNLTGPLPAISTAPKLLRNPCSPHTQPAKMNKNTVNLKYSKTKFKWNNTWYTVDDRIEE